MAGNSEASHYTKTVEVDGACGSNTNTDQTLTLTVTLTLTPARDVVVQVAHSRLTNEEAATDVG